MKEERRLRLRRFVLIDAFPVKELLAFVLLFLGVMVVLFPGWTLRDLLFHEEGVNLRLHVKYLEALAEIRPSPEILEALALSYAQLGRREKVSEIVKALEHYPGARYRAIRIEYEFLKRDYFSAGSEEEKKDIKKRLEALLRDMVRLSSDEETLKWIFRESVSMNAGYVSFLSAKELALTTGDRKWVREAMTRAFYLGRYKDVVLLGEKYKADDSSSLIMMFRSYYQLRDYKKAYIYLKLYLDKNPQDLHRFTDELIWLTAKVGKDPVSLILDMIRKTPSKQDRKGLIRKAIEYSLGTGNYSLAKKLISRHATSFVSDKDFTNFIIRSALATGDPEFAGEIAERIARAVGVLNGKDN